MVVRYKSYLTASRPNAACDLYPINRCYFIRRVGKIYHLTNEAAAVGFFWENARPFLAIEFVFDVDGVAAQLEEVLTSYGAKPDGIWGGKSTLSSSPGA